VEQRVFGNPINGGPKFLYRVKPMADGPSFWYEKLVRETWYKKLIYKSHTEPSKFLVRETRPMTETTKNFKFYFFKDRTT